MADPTSETELLLDVLPAPLRERAAALPVAELLEIVMDLGRAPEARLADRVARLSDDPVTAAELRHVLERVGTMGDDNRAGLERTLHRVSAIRNRKGDVVGLTMRVGRAVFGTIDMVRDLVESGRNLLLLGRPGVGKTTKLRELARVLADELGKRVIIVDTSNEIGGDGDIPHPGIGGARRMQVSHPERQHAVMIEAVENHMPEAIIVDEIGTSAEAAAARTIAERGVQLVATAHGTTLENLVLNPTISDLVGGVHTVTLSDEEARRRGTPKTITERKGPPTFDAVVELVSRDEVLAHRDTAQSVDRLLAGQAVGGERRQLVEGRVKAEAMTRGAAAPLPRAAPASAEHVGGRNGRARLYIHGVSRELVNRVLDDMELKARLVDAPERADIVLVLRARSNEQDLRDANARGVPVHVLKKNSSAEIRRALRNAFSVVSGIDEGEVREAVAEAEHAIARVMSEGVPVPLAPRRPELRKVQHRIVSRFHLEAASSGREPLRHLVIYPAGVPIPGMH